MRSPAGALLATVVGSLGTACSDVVVDSIVVERSRNAPQVRPDCSTRLGNLDCDLQQLPPWTLQALMHLLKWKRHACRLQIVLWSPS